MSDKFSQVSDEYLQLKMEETVCEQYELHGWATTVSVANPLEILIMLEEDDDNFEPVTTKTIAKTTIRGTIS